MCHQILALPEVDGQNRVEDLVRLNLDRWGCHGDGDCQVKVEYFQYQVALDRGSRLSLLPKRKRELLRDLVIDVWTKKKALIGLKLV
jgi:hypothetical protein